MPTEVLTRRPNPHLAAAALGARREVEWDKALQNNPGFVHEAAYRGFPHAQRAVNRAVAHETAILADPLRTPNIGPLLDAPIFNQLAPQAEVAPVEQKLDRPTRTPEEITADWDRKLQSDPRFVQEAARRGFPHAQAALARFEAQRSAPRVEIKPDDEHVEPLSNQEPAREGVLINIFSGPLIQRDTAPTITATEREWTPTEKFQLVQAGLEGYALQRKVDGDKTDVIKRMRRILKEQSVGKKFFPYFHDYVPTPDASLQGYLDDIRYIGSRQAQLGRSPAQVVAYTTGFLAEYPESLSTLRGIFATAKTAEEVGIALKNLNRNK
jgi:hypothetical protein